MSRIESLKKEFPYLNISIIDILSDLDGTKSHKYLHLLCKIFGTQFKTPYDNEPRNHQEFMESVERNLTSYKIKLSDNEAINFSKYRIIENIFRNSDLQLFQEFKEFVDKGLVVEKDVCKYSNFESLRSAISLAQIKLFEKELESQIFKEYEDDKWLMVRPLSFESSSKYGAGTRWCTTYKKEKQYFYKYFKNGSLVYIINKETGYKAAMYAECGKEKIHEITFWNSEDNRVDFLDLNIDLYLIDTIKRIKYENKTNMSFCDLEQTFKVANECMVNDYDEITPPPTIQYIPHGEGEPIQEMEVPSMRI